METPRRPERCLARAHQRLDDPSQTPLYGSPTYEQVVEDFKAKTERSPQWEVVDPDEPIDAKAGASVVPRDVADEPAEKPAAPVLDSEDAGAVERGAEHERTLPEPVMRRLEE